MDPQVTGLTQRASAIPFSFFHVDMKEFSFKVGVKTKAWMSSLRGDNPKQVFVHMMVSHVDPNAEIELNVITQKFTKLCNQFESYLKLSIYDSVKELLDETTTCVNFWVDPEDHTKMRKPDEKIRNLSKSLFHALYDKHVPSSLGEFYHILKDVRSNGTYDNLTIDVGDGKVMEFTSKPYFTFLKSFASLAKKNPGLYSQEYYFKVHPNGTTVFDLEQTRANKPRADPYTVLREAQVQAKRMIRDLLVKEKFIEVVPLGEFLSVVSSLTKQVGEESEGFGMMELQSFFRKYPDFQKNFPNVCSGELFEYLNAGPPTTHDPPRGAHSHGRKDFVNEESKETFTPSFAKKDWDYSRFFTEEDEE